MADHVYDPAQIEPRWQRVWEDEHTWEVSNDEVSEDDVLEATLDAGAEEVNDLDEVFQVQSEATDVVEVRTALQAAGIDYDSADVEFVASMEIPVADSDSAGKVFRLVDALEDLDDVQNVFGNFDIPDDVLEALDA